jgi:hypothetical protein
MLAIIAANLNLPSIQEFKILLINIIQAINVIVGECRCRNPGAEPAGLCDSIADAHWGRSHCADNPQMVSVQPGCRQEMRVVNSPPFIRRFVRKGAKST